MTTLTAISSKEELDVRLAILPASTLVVLYFYTPWTAVCTSLGITLSEIAAQYPTTSPPTIAFLSINGKDLPNIAKEYKASVAPCVIFLREGKVLQLLKVSETNGVHDAVEHSSGKRLKAHSPDSVAISSDGLDSDLIARLQQLVCSAPIVLFMKGTPQAPRCRFSRRLVDILRDRSIEYDSFDVLADEDVRTGLKEFGDWPTFPQLWVAGELVGGLEIVRTLPICLQQNLFSDFDIGSGTHQRESSSLGNPIRKCTM